MGSLDLSRFLVKNHDKKTSESTDKKCKNISKVEDIKKSAIKHDVVNNLLHALVMPIAQDRIISKK